jgi:hypothetical protein
MLNHQGLIRQLLNVSQFPSSQALSPVSSSRTRVILLRMPTIGSSFARLTALCLSLFATCIPMCLSGKGLKAAMTVSLIVGAVRTLVETTTSLALRAPVRLFLG